MDKPLGSGQPLSVRERLKAATRADHEAAEAALFRAGCFRSSAGHALFLKAMTRCQERFGEAAKQVEAASGLESRDEELRRALSRDLKRLRVAGVLGCREGESNPLRVSSDEAWGAQYALEGSAMGAARLAPVSAALYPDGASSDYLSLLAGSGPARWRSFVVALENAQPEPDAAVEGAKRVFETIRETLEGGKR